MGLCCRIAQCALDATCRRLPARVGLNRAFINCAQGGNKANGRGGLGCIGCIGVAVGGREDGIDGYRGGHGLRSLDQRGFGRLTARRLSAPNGKPDKADNSQRHPIGNA